MQREDGAKKVRRGMAGVVRDGRRRDDLQRTLYRAHRLEQGPDGEEPRHGEANLTTEPARLVAGGVGATVAYHR